MQESPAAVAARMEARKKTERVALIAAVNFLRDTKQAIEAANRPKQEWDW